MSNPVIQALRAGDLSKPDPFTICIVANPALEAPWNSGTFIADPVLTGERYPGCPPPRFQRLRCGPRKELHRKLFPEMVTADTK